MQAHLSRTMTISQAEFLRSLLPLKHHYRIEIDEAKGEVEISDQGLRVVISLLENRPLKLGSLSMPSLKVYFSFRDTAADEVARFWSRFDLCFRRGGG
ncbi:MAG: hypothetical protein KME56_00510 [Candidatus Thiodiazotropha sp. (ex Ctena orbiculata)]|uniref:Uncharacterized protein n=1 Tax=Candidatus Thiodiazotropha taylori TaxID=2792791 RepID=A0A944MA57_9GAMM|nr:hypothetical protein [Candidatus Thiodiazotropha taylori]PUB89366.1 MAG: hypothetical protein DBP00_02730 [gamma proteobacterium symbiont of Ctena orbiculata]MBT2987642.1 hypothetical protein [Candidatus Thiodiazotropha taylori]MBT2995103.1 hypothetical protein [Candidatus Thiodiazotropha taylori]MBT2999978.1 hypothetical protein [Candidatus Thiodiazotropha taylori]